jgi:hypothetical protein
MRARSEPLMEPGPRLAIGSSYAPRTLRSKRKSSAKDHA